MVFLGKRKAADIGYRFLDNKKGLELRLREWEIALEEKKIAFAEKELDFKREKLMLMIQERAEDRKMLMQQQKMQMNIQ